MLIAAHIRQALRTLRRDPTLAFAATATLAIAIGANTTVFSLVNAVLLRPLPYPASDRLYAISEHMGRGQMEAGIAADYYSLSEENRVFSAVAAYGSLTVNWMGTEKAEQVDAAQVTPSFFRVMGTQPMLGRYLAAGEEGSKAPPVVVLSYPFWRSRLGSDPHIVGKTISLDRLPHTVLGVMPQGFDYPSGTQIWRPLPIDESSTRPRLVTRSMALVNILARLRPEIPEAQLDSEMSRLTAAIRAEYPKDFESAGFLNGISITAIPLQKRIAGDLRPALLVLSGAVGLVLLIACVNLANLLLARSSARRREMAVRLALGSSRGRLARHVLTESLMLALPGGIVGTGIALYAVAALNALKPLVLVRYPPISLDLRTLLFTLGLTLFTGLMFGLAPALAASATGIHESLKAAGATQSGGPKATRARQALVVAELATSLVLLIGAGLLARSFLKLASNELGFPADHLLTMRVNLTGAAYARAEGQKRFYEDLLARLKQLPMVRSAAVTTDMPLDGERHYSSFAFNVEGRPPLPMAQRPGTDSSVVSRDFFQTMGIPLKAGRIFTAQDPADRALDDKTALPSPPGIVVNETFARQIFPGEDPVGRTLLLRPDGSSRVTIIGVVGSIRGSSLGADPPRVVYHCLECSTGNPFLSRLGLVIRTSGDPRAAIAAASRQVSAVDRSIPVFDIRTMQERLSNSLAPQRFQLLLIGAFAIVAILLAAAGVYGVMSYLIARRTREIGIRMAMGARPEDVLRLVLGETVMLIVVSIFAGLAGAWALTRYVKSMLYGVTELDAPAFAIALAVLAATVVLASLGPARRAASVDPITALREE